MLEKSRREVAIKACDDRLSEEQSRPDSAKTDLIGRKHGA
jgi:hypothetical protein